MFERLILAASDGQRWPKKLNIGYLLRYRKLLVSSNAKIKLFWRPLDSDLPLLLLP